MPSSISISPPYGDSWRQMVVPVFLTKSDMVELWYQIMMKLK